MATNNAKTGTVENVELTFGSAGNQWTTIDGVRYATWWNWNVHNFQPGDRVSFIPRKGKLFDNMVSTVDIADNVRLVARAAA